MYHCLWISKRSVFILCAVLIAYDYLTESCKVETRTLDRQYQSSHQILRILNNGPDSQKAGVLAELHNFSGAAQRNGQLSSQWL